VSHSLAAARWCAPLMLAGGAFLHGCAVVPHTSVVLLPDEDGHVGAVLVGSAGASQRIDQAYSAVTVEGAKSAPSNVTSRGQPSVETAYATLMKAQPSKPKTFILHFQLDSVALTDESKALVPEVLRVAKERKPTEITVYGHADSSGSEERNTRLSAERARVVADLLRKSDPTLENLQVQYFGDREPLVPTEGRVPEPRNRRAEVVIL
jgi:outer membrane protein OmpA-like peptidoglycan-associated protein